MKVTSMQPLLITKDEKIMKNTFPLNLKDHIILFEISKYSSSIYEGKVLCYSPSQKYVKIQKEDKQNIWKQIENLNLIEDLGKTEESFSKELLLENQNGLKTTSIFNDNHGLSLTTITESKAN